MIKLKDFLMVARNPVIVTNGHCTLLTIDKPYVYYTLVDGSLLNLEIDRIEIVGKTLKVRIN